MTTYSVSVVIPTYNAGPYLVEAVESVFRQTVPPCELIVVDDASSDGTADVANSLARRSAVPFRVIELRRNSGGPALPMNTGIAAASGKLIAVLDQDDEFFPRKIEVQSALLAAREDVTVVASYCGDFRDPNRILQSADQLAALNEACEKADGVLWFSGHEFLRLLLTYQNLLFGYPGFMFRKRDWERKGGIDNSLINVSDYDTLLWLSGRGRVAVFPEVHFRHRYHANNLSMRKRAALIEFATVVARHLKANPWLKGDPRVAETYAVTYFLGLAARACWAGRYKRGLSLFSSAVRLWGLGPSSLLKICRKALTKAGVRRAVARPVV
jgi:glycosyltransferase involved in cell wall biosynthesis